MEEALLFLSKHYNVESDKIKNILEINFKNNIQDILLPYYGNIDVNKCKALVFNHGLYTQCNKNVNKNDFCKNCDCKKYGTVYDRQKYELGKYISPFGKKEINYNKFIEKMNYNLDDVKRKFLENNISYPLEEVKINNVNKKGRGRPKKKIEEVNKNETIEVERIVIDGTTYLRTLCNVLLNSVSYEIVGLLEDGIIKCF